MRQLQLGQDLKETFVDEVIDRLAGLYRPSDLSCSGFLAYADHRFRSCSELIQSNVIITNNPNCLVEFKGLITDTSKSLGDIYNLVQNLWDLISYQTFKASSCLHYQQACVLRFVTLEDPYPELTLATDGSYISGRIVVSSTIHSKLTSEGMWRGRFPRLPDDIHPLEPPK